MRNSKNRNEENWGRLNLDLRKPADAVAPVILGPGVGATEAEHEKVADPSYLAAIDTLTQGDEGQEGRATTTVPEIADALDRAPQTVRETLKGMGERGFVTYDKDRSPHAISLTDKGRRARKGAKEGQTQKPGIRRKGSHPLRESLPSSPSSDTDEVPEEVGETLRSVLTN